MDTSQTIIPTGVIAKNFSYVIALLTYLNITPVSVAVLGGLILCDVITGIAKSIALHGPRSIQSSVMQRGIVAKCLLIVAPTSIAFAGRGIGFDLSVITQNMIDVLILSEAYSIIGNIYAVRTGQERVEFDAIAYVLGHVRELLKAFIKDDTL